MDPLLVFSVFLVLGAALVAGGRFCLVLARLGGA